MSKIIKIEKEKDIFTVTFRPNFFGRLVGLVDYTEKYKKDLINTYAFGGGGVYYKQNGEALGNLNKIGKALDNYQNSW